MKSMKKILRRICSGMLVFALVLALMPSFMQMVYAEEGEPVTTPDETIIATTQSGAVDGDNTCYWYNSELFYVLAALVLDDYESADEVEAAVKNGSTVTLTYGNVKTINKFTVSENMEISSLSMLNMWLPNLEELEVNSTKLYFGSVQFDDIPRNIKSLSINAHIDNEESGMAYFIDLCDLSVFGSLETLNICVDGISFTSTFKLPDSIKNLTLAATRESNSSYDFVVTKINEATGLESLELSGQSYAKDVSYAGFTNLKTLVLNDCDLTTTTFPELTGMDQLETLSVAGNDMLVKTLVLQKVPQKFAKDEDWISRNFTEANELVTTGDKVSDYYVPDQNLYAALLRSGDRDQDGMLTVGEAATVTLLDGSCYGVKTWEGLAKVAPNLSSVNCTREDATWENYYSQISQLTKLHSLSVCVENETELSGVFSLVNLTSLNLTINSIENVDLTGISALNELEYLNLEYLNDSYEEKVEISALNKLDKLKGLSMYGDFFVISQLDTLLLNRLVDFTGSIQSDDEVKIIKELKNADSLNLTFYGESAYSVDLSDMNSLNNIYLRGYLTSVQLPTNAENIRSVDIINTGVTGYTDISRHTKVVNLGKSGGLCWLKLVGCNIGNLSAIQNMTSLYHLQLDNCNLTNTEGIGNLTNLTALSLCCNFNLTSIDEGIKNLTKLTDLGLSYNSLTELPDLSALTNLTRESIYMGSYGGRVRLFGNCLTEDAIVASKLDDKLLKDSNWMILSTTGKCFDEYGNLNIFYTKLPSSYIWKQIENWLSVSFRTNCDVTLDAELISYLKSSNKSVGIFILSVNDDYTLNQKIYYNVSSYNLANWTEDDGNIELKKIPYTLIKDDSQFDELLSGKIYGSVTIPADAEVSPFASAQITWKSEGASAGYRILKYNGTILKDNNINYNTNDICVTINHEDLPREYCTYIAADQYVRIYNNLSGGYCEKEIIPIDKFGVFASDYSSWQTPLNALIDAASSGDTITMAATYACGNFTQDNLQKLMDKKIKLVVYSGWFYGADNMPVDTVRTMDFGKAGSIVSSPYSVPVYYASLYLNNFESAYYPELLFNGVKKSAVSCSVTQTMKSYVGNQYANGEKLNVYRIDYANHEAVLEDEITVNYGCIEFELEKGERYFITDEKITTTTWEEEISPIPPIPPVNPDDATGGNADPDEGDNEESNTTPDEGDNEGGDVNPPEEEDKCADGHTWTEKTQTAPTCTKSGVGVKTCSVCGEQEEYAIPATGHTWTGKTLTAATCTKEGVGIRTCSVCAEQEEYVIPAKGHNWNATYTLDKSATATEDGVKSIHCIECNEIKPGSDIIIEKYGVEVTLPEISVEEVTSTIGEQSAPIAVEQGQIASKSEAVELLIEKMEETIAPKVEIYTTGVIPAMSSNLFEAATEKNKDIVLGAVNENNQLIYSWTFDYDAVDVSKVPEEGLNLAITFETEKKKEIEELTGRTNALYISIEGYHGELPGPATVKTYVGNDYKNGDTVYLYYYNEESKRIELVGNKGLIVKEGYVEYVLTHCSTYFVSEEEPATFGIQINAGDIPPASTDQTSGADSTSNNQPATVVPSGNASNVTSPVTGDSFPFVPLACLIAGLGVVGFTLSIKKEKQSHIR